MDFVELARQAWDAGDFDKARMFYQKASYGIHDTDQANKDAFAQEVAGFAGQDPLYQKGLALIRDHIRQQGKPVLQSEMTAYVKKHWGDAQTEQLRYVLYYAEVRKEICRKKQGRSYLLALSEADLVVARLPKVEQKKSSLHTKLFEPNQPYQPPTDAPYIHSADIAELYRDATRYKDEGNWLAALACLFKAKQLTEKELQDFPQRLRLPLFLQQAGHFEAAKYEFIYLLEQMDNFVALEVAGRLNLRQQKSFVKNHNLELLFDKACLIFQREKDLERAERCRKLSEQYKEKRIAANEALKAARQKRIRAHREEYHSASPPNVSTAQQEIFHHDTIRAQPTQTRPFYDATPEPVVSAKKKDEKGCLNTAIGLVVVVLILFWIFA